MLNLIIYCIRTIADNFFSASVPAPGPQAGTAESTPLAPTEAIPAKAPGTEKS